MITSTSSAGIHRQLLLNESVILVEKSDIISFLVDNTSKNDSFQLIFRFSDTGKEYSSTLNLSNSPNTYDITLFRWNGISFIETQKAWEVVRNNITYWVHWRTFSTDKMTQRVFEVSIWTSITPQS
jgi:hypothetical protein